MGSTYLLIALTCLSADPGGKELAPVELHGLRREPVAAVFLDDNLAAIACAKSGTLIFWDVKNGTIKQEYQVGQQLRGVARWHDDELLAIDEKSNELIQLRWSTDRLTELRRYKVPDSPMSLCAFENAGDEQVAVTSLWARQVTIWNRDEQPVAAEFSPLAHAKTIDLPSEPRFIVPMTYDIPDRAGTGRLGPYVTLAVSEAFGGRFTLIGPRHGNSAQESTGSQNIGGMAFIAQRGKLYLSTERLAERTPITAEKTLSGEILRSYLTEHELGLEGYGLQQRFGPPSVRFFPVPGQSSGDAAGLAFTSRSLLVCLAGADQVWVTNPAGVKGQRINVGKRPRFITSRANRALVLGELDDSLSLIDVSNVEHPTVRTSSLDAANTDRKLTPAERGERLFFDARLSAGGMMSCHSCHTDGHTNGLLADTLGDNSHGTPKRVLTLRGTRLTDLWAWNGEMKTLQDNVHKSLQDTMHAPKIEPRDVDDIVSFLHTLPPVPPLKPAAKDDLDRLSVAHGERVFAREGCANCHVPPLTFTSHAAYDVGLEDEKGLKKFNPPSLRGVGRLRRLFHDNRASSLRDVFETHGHQLTEPLSERDLADLVRYLESL